MSALEEPERKEDLRKKLFGITVKWGTLARPQI